MGTRSKLGATPENQGNTVQAMKFYNQACNGDLNSACKDSELKLIIKDKCNLHGYRLMWVEKPAPS